MRDDNECDSEWNTNRFTVRQKKSLTEIKQRKGAPVLIYYEIYMLK